MKLDMGSERLERKKISNRNIFRYYDAMYADMSFGEKFYVSVDDIERNFELPEEAMKDLVSQLNKIYKNQLIACLFNPNKNKEDNHELDRDNGNL